MVASYPVNDYRGYLAHKAPSFSNAADWNEADQHKYYKREWTGKGWRYYYTKEQWDSAHSRQHDLNELRESRREKREGGKSGSESVDKNRAKEMTGDYRVSSQVKSAVRPIAGNNVANAAAKAVVGAQNTAEAVGNEVSGRVRTASGAVKRAVNDAATAIGDAVRQAPDAIAGAATDAYHAVSESVASAVDWVKTFGEEQGRVYDEPMQTVEPVLDKDGKPVMTEDGVTPETRVQYHYADTIAGNVTRIADSITNWVKTAYTNVSAFVQKSFYSIKKWSIDAKKSIAQFYKDTQTYVNGIIKDIKNSEQYKAIMYTIGRAFRMVQYHAGQMYHAVAKKAVELGTGEEQLDALNSYDEQVGNVITIIDDAGNVVDRLWQDQK